MNLSAAWTGRVARPLLNHGFCGRGYLLLDLITGACAGACDFCLTFTANIWEIMLEYWGLGKRGHYCTNRCTL